MGKPSRGGTLRAQCRAHFKSAPWENRLLMMNNYTFQLVNGVKSSRTFALVTPFMPRFVGRMVKRAVLVILLIAQVRTVVNPFSLLRV